jgi:histidine ammonia-lyase
MGGYAARKSMEMLDNISYILGIELMCALQSVNLIRKKPSEYLYRIHQNARKFIKYLDKDCYFGEELEIAKELVMNNLEILAE